MTYTAVLTGTPDATSYLVLGVHTAQVYQNTTEARCRLTGPVTHDLVGAIDARPNGNLVFTHDSGEEYCNIPITGFRYERDGAKRTGILEGTGTYSNGSPTTIGGDQHVFILNNGFSPSNRYRIAIPVGDRARPGDTITCLGRTFVIGFSTWFFGTPYSYVEVRDGNSG